ncbi:hypothetical protein D3C86_2004550 [compost metagenome]
MQFNRNTTVGDLLANPLTAAFAQKYSNVFGMDSLENNPDMFYAMMKYMPLRALISFGEGKYTEEELTLDLGELEKLMTAK